MILLDSNVLVYGLNADAPAHHTCKAIIEGSKASVVPGVLVPQVLLEAYCVLTDRRRVRRPAAAVSAWAAMETLAQAIPVIYPGRAALEEFGVIAGSHGPVAQNCYDAFLVAQMRAAGIGVVCSFDHKDFFGYTGIAAETPERVADRFNLKP